MVRHPGPGWVQHAIWWHVYPLGFTGAEPLGAPGRPVRHRLDRLVDWLDYAVELGVLRAALGPVFASETHGYDTVDHFRIDPRLGDDADFDAAGRGRPRPRPARAARRRVQPRRPRLPGVPRGCWRRARGAGRRTGSGSHGPTGPMRVRAGLRDFEGHRELVALNHDSPRCSTTSSR